MLFFLVLIFFAPVVRDIFAQIVAEGRVVTALSGPQNGKVFIISKKKALERSKNCEENPFDESHDTTVSTTYYFE